MQIKLVTVDFRLSENAKWAIRWALLPLGVLVGSMAVARAYDTAWIASGTTVSATKLKADLDEAQTRITALEGQVHPSSAFRAEVTKATTIQNNATTPVVFDSPQYDLASEYNKSTGTFSPSQAGYYFVQCGFDFGVPVGTVINAAVQKNGAEVSGFDNQSSNSGLGVSTATSSIVQLAKGDALTCTTYQASGSAQSLVLQFPSRNFFSAARLY
jgi:hypothetical protein